MCDYCDCRSHPQVAALSADHEVLQHLLAELRVGLDGQDGFAARRVLTRLHRLLDDHAAREERGIFAELRRADVGDRYVEAFEADHDALHRLLDRVDRPGWQQAARSLIDLLGSHIAREESDLFPAAHQLLAPEQWDAVDAAVTLEGVS